VRLPRSDPDLAADRLAMQNRRGVVLKAAGRLDEAARCYEQVVIAISAMPDPPADLVAVSLHNRAGLAYARSDLAAAETLIRAAISQRERGFAPDVDIAADRGVLGAVLVAQHRDDQAREVLHDVLAAMEREHGKDHYEVAVVLHNLATLEQRHDPTRAQERYERALATKRRRLGARHHEVGVLLNNLATLHRQGGRHAIAVRLGTEAHDILRRVHGSMHPTTRACERNLRLATQAAKIAR